MVDFGVRDFPVLCFVSFLKWQIPIEPASRSCPDSHIYSQEQSLPLPGPPIRPLGPLSVTSAYILLSLEISLGGLPRELREYQEDHLGLFLVICGSLAVAAAATAATDKTRILVNW